MAFCLSSFPPELIGHTLNTEDGSFLIVRLWLCGDRRLNAKLVNCMTCVSLASNWSLQFGLPSVLFNLGSLRSLTLKSKGRLMKRPMDWASVLQRLPESLTSLAIESLDCVKSLLNYAPQWSPNLPLVVTTLYTRGLSQYINLECRFPQLVSLKLSKSILAIDLPGLPPTLTYLSARISQLESGIKPILSVLPRSLRHLKATLESPKSPMEIQDWFDAPPLLESIRTIDVPLPEGDVDYSWIPRSLKSFRFQGPSKFPISISPKSMSTLPPFLEKLTVSATEETMLPEDSSAGRLSYLPMCLTSLHLQLNFEARGIGFSERELRTLPRTLRKLYLDTDRIDFESIALLGPSRSLIWPPKLTVLNMAVPMLISHLELLPSSIRTLVFNVRPDPPSVRYTAPIVIKSSTLPAALTDLHLVILNGDVEFKGKIPPGITHLGVLNYSRVPQTLCYETVRSSLPPVLTNLQANLSPASSIQDMSIALRYLTRLSTAFFRAKHFSLLSTSITSLSIVLLDFAPKSELGLELPSSLTDLKISSCPHHETLGYISLRHLTRLKHLELPSQLSLRSIMMRHLPASLIYLKMRLEAIEEEDVPFMPPLLEDADIFWGSPILLISNFGQHWPLALTRGLPRHAEAKFMERRAVIGAGP